ncbi:MULTISPECIES: hypothetical protein [Bradyrhizobium]|uniref:hypothetical protein n=1 Tax=Bradyrhizobium TaxID=374 RepID=UPI00155DE072|nr:MULTISPECIES: hypothetical protein [Bradyrhizobium]MDD1522184.1 hypothetical protein [Bradyrhizobium sp. WBAH30]MDD1541388.1 hypothetical protein [Bradyrhizobium sp. WBAH41]MDD1556988.1 hypothetical protein [Bradyrhizobium sp. WBAH23]MDD1564789.1 hypothetical protein [Bradyrhizobium sp. WBAH33]MDD1589658.1 hypothetical protein [Bradyrhizobium sp. WBAH42]
MRRSVSKADVPNLARHYRSVWDVFRAPLLVGLVCAVGLGLALVGDGIWDGLSWLALSLPVGLAAFYWHRAGRRR